MRSASMPRAAYVASQAAVRHMTDGGRIISIGSNLAERVPFPGVALYSMSKSALIGFTKGLARDLGDRGITVNLVQPGSTDTDMNPADGPSADDQRALSALGRYANPTDIADAVAFLTGPGVPQRHRFGAHGRRRHECVMRMAWLVLVCAGLLEIVWATALKQSDGFSRLWPSVVGIGGALVSFLLLAVALRHLPAGTGYAVWVGIGGWAYRSPESSHSMRPSAPHRLLFLSLIVVGIVGSAPRRGLGTRCAQAIKCCRRCCAGSRHPAGTAGRQRRRASRHRRTSC